MEYEAGSVWVGFVWEVVVHSTPEWWHEWPERSPQWSAWYDWCEDRGLVIDEAPNEPDMPRPSGMLNRRRYLTKAAAMRKIERLRRFGAVADLIRWEMCDGNVVPFQR